MGLPKGRTNNLKGRPKGSKNRIGKDLRESLNEIIANNFDSFINDMADLTPKDRITVMLRLFEFVAPKMKPVDAIQLDNKESSNEWFEEMGVSGIL